MSRTRQQDGCPGALRTHPAADGPLARIRLPGGMLSPAQLEALAAAATDCAGGTLELTARGNVQIRAITDTAALAAAVAAAGLLPSPEHELVRNIVASPLSGRSGGLADLRGAVARLDAAIRAEPALAALPGRFLFGLDDGTGDISGLGADAGVQVLPDGRAALLLAGRDTGVRVPLDDAVPALIAVAHRFAAVRGPAWRIAELPDTGVLLAGHPVSAGGRVQPAAVTRPPVGWIAQDDGRVALGAAVPLGVLSARQALFVAAVNSPVVITPWRSLLVCDLDEEVADTALGVLPGLGLVFDETSGWLEVSACVGTPGCERSRADVRAAAAAAVGAARPTGPVHFAGCERVCGRPASGRVLIAGPDGRLPVPGDDSG